LAPPAPAGATDAWSLDGPRATRGGQRRRPAAISTSDQFFVYGVAFLVILGLVGVGGVAAAPWRADRAYDKSLELLARAVGQDRAATEGTWPPAPPDRQALERAYVALQAARRLNPWEPRYYVRGAINLVVQAAREPTGSERQADLLDQAHALYRQVIRVEPGGPMFILAYGDALLRLYEAQPNVGQARDQALASLRRAQQVSPRDPSIAARLAAAEAMTPK
jgi:tetratricopeptide (TPR) repeat protein